MLPGGTVDITTVEIEENGTMKQIFTSGGGHWGGMKVNTIRKLLLKLNKFFLSLSFNVIYTYLLNMALPVIQVYVYQRVVTM